MSTVTAKLRTDIIVGEWVTTLRKQLRTKLPSKHDAEDIAQEACVRLLQEHGKDKEIHNPKAYLFQIAYNLLYQHYAAHKRRPTFSDIDLELIQSADEDLDALILHTIRRQQINKAFSQLSAKCQTALILRWRDGLRIAEIATEMDLSRSMVKKYLATGLAHFRRRLGRFVLGDQVAG